MPRERDPLNVAPQGPRHSVTAASPPALPGSHPRCVPSPEPQRRLNVDRSEGLAGRGAAGRVRREDGVRIFAGELGSDLRPDRAARAPAAGGSGPADACALTAW